MTALTPGAPDVAPEPTLCGCGDALGDGDDLLLGLCWVCAEDPDRYTTAYDRLGDRLDALEAVVGAVRATRSLYEHADGTPRLAIMGTPEGDQLARDRDAAKLVSRAALDRLPR